MTPIDYTAEVVECVRRTAFAGSDRPVPTDVPFDEHGLGLDSLAFVEVLTDLEQRFGVQIFESEWFEAEDRTVQSLGAYLSRAAKAAPGRV